MSESLEQQAATLPKRSVDELVQALRVRADYLTGEKWEAPATAAMMREAAEALQRVQAEATPHPAPQDIETARAIAKMLRLFRLDAAVAGSRMSWATDWPLDRLMCEAADKLDLIAAALAAKEAEREQLTNIASGQSSGLVRSGSSATA